MIESLNNIINCPKEYQEYGYKIEDGEPYFGKINNFDTLIAKEIGNLNQIVSNVYDGISDDDKDTDKAKQIKAFKDDLSTNPDYKKLFSKYFNAEYYSKMKNTTYTFIQKSQDDIMDIRDRYPEYNLMTRHIGMYDCCYPETLKELLRFYFSYFVDAKLLCPAAQKVAGLINYIQDTENYIITNNINDDDTSDERQSKEEDNVINRIEGFYSKISDFADDVGTQKNDFIELFQLINNYKSTIIAYLKLISIVNIILTAKNEENEDFERYSQIITGTTPETVDYVKDDMIKYYEKKVVSTIPLIIQFKAYLKKDLSNFKTITTQAIVAAANAATLPYQCKKLYEALISIDYTTSDISNNVD